MKSDLERAREAMFERWPGYAEQSWSERFAELDKRFGDLERQVAILAFAKSECATRDAEIERLTAARNLAYGLLWGMSIDRRRVSDDLAARARETLLATMSKDDQRAGIDAARAALSNKDAG